MPNVVEIHNSKKRKEIHNSAEEAEQKLPCLSHPCSGGWWRTRQGPLEKPRLPPARRQSPRREPSLCSVTRLSCAFPGCSVCLSSSWQEGWLCRQRRKPRRGGQVLPGLTWSFAMNPGRVTSSLCKALWVTAAAELTSSVKQQLSLEPKDPWQEVGGLGGRGILFLFLLGIRFLKFHYFRFWYSWFTMLLASGVQQNGLVVLIRMHMSILFQILLPYRLLQDIEQHFPCYTVDPHWLSILYIALGVC